MNESADDLRAHAVSRSAFADGATAGVGSLPHHDAAEAAAFAIDEFDIATIPTMPHRSPVELMLGQALVGVPGVSIDADGVVVDAALVERYLTVSTDINHPAFDGFRAFIDRAHEVRLDGAAVKWQFVGPVTLGVALHRAGLDRATAFDLALSVVRARLAALSQFVTEALPTSRQMVVLDEPWFAELMQPGFPAAARRGDRPDVQRHGGPAEQHPHRCALLRALRCCDTAGRRTECGVVAGVERAR